MITNLLLSGVAALAIAAAAAPALKSFYDFSANSIDGKPVALSAYKGKKVLVVNTASECGYTPQYADLEKLYEAHKDKLVILGFPANNFGGQEPGSNSEIRTFCTKNYGVTFPMMSKVDVVGKDAHPLFKWLASKQENGVSDGAPKWNFTKYLIDEKGNLVKMYPSSVKPSDPELLAAIEK